MVVCGIVFITVLLFVALSLLQCGCGGIVFITVWLFVTLSLLQYDCLWHCLYYSMIVCSIVFITVWLFVALSLLQYFCTLNTACHCFLA